MSSSEGSSDVEIILDFVDGPLNVTTSVAEKRKAEREVTTEKTAWRQSWNRVEDALLLAVKRKKGPMSQSMQGR